MKYVYSFEEGNKDMKDLLGGKGANLAEMTSLGIPVPPGFTITTEVCARFASDGMYPDGFADQLGEEITALEEEIGRRFGDVVDPLLVSVRSGAKVSMPGMMDTVLNLGLNDETVVALAKKSGSERFAYDCYRRFIQMFGNVVMGIPGENFEEVLSKMKEARGVELDPDLVHPVLGRTMAELLDSLLEEGQGIIPLREGRCGS